MLRKTQISVLTNDTWMDAKWQDIAYKDLKKGDIFRLFEADGTRVTNGRDDVWLADSDAYYNDEDDDWGIKCTSLTIQ